MIDAILWDNDGVLVDTEILFLESTREILAEVGVVIDAEIYREISLTQGRTLFDLARDVGCDDSACDAMKKRRNARYAEMIDEGVRVMDGAQEVLAKLHGAIPMAIVTSSYRDHFDQIHEQTGMLSYFEFVLAHGDYARGKPQPDPYLDAAKRIGVSPERCLVIEDSERGLTSAVRAGMKCALVPNALTEAGDFSSAYRILGSLHELPALVADLRRARGAAT